MNEFEEDFGAMFEASQQATRVAQGQTVEGTIVSIGPEVALVDVGSKSEAVLDVHELKDRDGVLEVAVGDRIQAVVVSTTGGVKLSRKLGRGAATDRQLEDAFQAGLPVEGTVEREVKGGYEVRVARSRAFCPFSQIDTVRVADPAAHIGRVYTFRITEFKEGGKDLVVSRRALLEVEQRTVADDIRRAVVVDAVLTGRVASVRDFGAFVDLGGGVQGLLHVSEMGWSRVADASQAVTPGDEITVKVLRVEEDGRKIALGLKQLTDDPWLAVSKTYEVGQVRTGRITRVADFGAFVELEPGVEALAHASTFVPTGRQDGWKVLVSAATTAPFEILSIDADKRRIGVALVPEGSARATERVSASPQGIAPGARLTGKVERHEPFGVFVFLGPGLTALMPSSETGVARETDVKQALPAGSDVEVIVLEADAAGRRIKVSRKAIFDRQEAEELGAYRDRGDAAPAGGLGSLADKLRGALGSGNR